MLKVNGKAYDWGDVDLKLPGAVVEVQEISYDDELEKELVYGAGRKPRGYGTGNYKASGKISFLRDDLDDLLAYCNKTGTPFYDLVLPKVVVSYAQGNGRITTDVLNRVSFSKRSSKAGQGDKSIKVDVDLTIAGVIEWGDNKSV